MTPFQRRVLRIKIELEWRKLRDDYNAAGKPFGDGRGMDLWVEHRQLTTVN